MDDVVWREKEDERIMEVNIKVEMRSIGGESGKEERKFRVMVWGNEEELRERRKLLRRL